jgi:hypothetical protein
MDVVNIFFLNDARTMGTTSSMMKGVFKKMKISKMEVRS